MAVTKMFDKTRASRGSVVSGPRSRAAETRAAEARDPEAQTSQTRESQAGHPQAMNAQDSISAARLDRLASHAMAHLVQHPVAPAPGQQQAPRPARSESHACLLAEALGGPDAGLAEAMVDDMLGAGVTIDQLLFDHLSPAARLLGEWWEADRMTFTTVTLAAARIQSILRRLPGARPRPGPDRGLGAMFAAVPGEQHTVGVTMATELFRRRGWDVALHVGRNHAELLHTIAGDDRPVVVFSCSGRRTMAALRRLVEDLRDARPDLALVVSGGMALDTASLRSLPRLDGVVRSLEGAEAVMTRVLRRGTAPG